MKKKKLLINILAIIVVSLTLLFIFSNDSFKTLFENSTTKITYRPPVSTTISFNDQVNNNLAAGTEADPYIISNTNDMNVFSTLVNNGNNFSGKLIVVAKDVRQLVLVDFTPIGTAGRAFSGTFDGSRVDFKLNINREAANYNGLFGYIQNAKIENLSVSGSVIGGNFTAGITGYNNNSTIDNVYNMANVTGTTNTGGFAGSQTGASAIIRYSYNIGKIVGTDNVGGFVGNVDTGYIDNSYNRGEVVGNARVGGFVGDMYSGSTSNRGVRYSYNAGPVSGTSSVSGTIGRFYSGQRTSIYYDTNVIADYEQPVGKSKPAIVGDAYGRTTDALMDSVESLSFNPTIWEARNKDGTYGYYPQLKVYKDNDNVVLQDDSVKSIRVNMNYGLGTVLYPKLIKTSQDVHELSRMVSLGNTYQGFYFKVIDGIFKLELDEFIPIGNNSRPFYGNFDGNFTEFNLIINRPDSYNGLFGYSGIGVIKNLSVSGSITGGSFTAGITGYNNNGVIENVYNMANVTGTTNTGGFAGSQTGASAIIRYSYNIGKIVGTDNVGGFVGNVDTGYIDNSYNRGEVVGNARVGGFVGDMYSGSTSNRGVRYSYNAGPVSGTSPVSGTIGRFYSGQRTNIYYDTNVIADYEQPVGKSKPAIVGDAYGKTTDFLVGNLSSLGFSNSYWIKKEGTIDTIYYPELLVFYDNNNYKVKNESNASISIDISGGLGTLEYPYLITNAADVHELSRMVLLGNTYQGFYFKVADNIPKLELEEFIPIGNKSRPFYGNFDGNFTEFNLIVNRTDPYNGLFGYSGVGVIKNLSVSGTIKGGSFTAGITGYNNNGVIENVYNMANVTGTTYTGGFAGSQTGASAIIRYSYNIGKIVGTDNVGGFVGNVDTGYIDNSYNRGEVVGNARVGGFVGDMYSGSTSNRGVRYSYNAGPVSGTASVSGTIGRFYSGQRTNIYYDTNVIADYEQPSGKSKPAIVGDAYGRTTDFLISNLESLGFSNSYWTIKDKTETEVYYPELLVFKNNNNQKVKNESNESVLIDITGGLGTSVFPYLIETDEDMHDLSRMVLLGNTYQGFYFKVAEGISILELGEFIPIGNSSRPFYGNFDGNFAEFNLTVNRTDSYNGLFGYSGVGVIKNLSVSGTITGGSFTAGITGYNNNGVIENVYNMANVTGTTNTGGFAGSQTGASAIIRYSYNIGKIVGTDNVGGFVGNVDTGYIDNSYNRGEVVGNARVGGFVGDMYSGSTSNRGVRYSYNAGPVSGTSPVSGTIGRFYSGQRTNIYYDTNVIADYEQPVGKSKPAIVGDAYGKTTDFLISTLDNLKFDSNYWIIKDKTETEVYYPELLVFKNNKNQKVKDESNESVLIDITGGLGTLEYPFLIETPEDMHDLSRMVLLGNTYQGFYFKVADNIPKLELGNFIPIGNNSRPFYGNFDGNFTEFNLTVNRSDSYNGLFGYSGVGVIKNLSVSGTITGGSFTAGITGYNNNGVIENVYNMANVTGTTNTGGFAGSQTGASAIIRYSYNIGKIVGTDNVGGFVGNVDTGYIDNSYNRGEVVGNARVGGFVGDMYSGSTSNRGVRYSYNAGPVSGTSPVSGTIGRFYSGQRTNIYYDSTVMTNYIAPAGKTKAPLDSATQKPSTDFFNNKMSAFGFSSSIWLFKEIEGNFAYYPQLLVFGNNNIERVAGDSIESVKTNPFEGNGTEISPYLIKSAYDMEILANSISELYDAKGIYYIVAAGISELNLTTVDFIGIGNENTPFRGNFNGVYTNFIINLDSDKNYQGLFGRLSSEAVVKNLSVTGDIKASNYVGAIAGYNEGLIDNVYAKVNITGNNYVGGLIGHNKGSINDMYSTGDVLALGSYVGGLIGYNDGLVDEGYYGGRIHGSSYVGGLIGYSSNDDVTNLFYNQTIIYYDDIIDELIKPIRAIGNKEGYETSGLEKEDLTGLLVFDNDDMTLDESKWKLTITNGLYDYYPQLKTFADNTAAVVRTNSLTYSRVIRFARGSGSKSNPYIIRDEDDMKALSDITISDNLLGLHFKVMDGVKELDLSDPSLGFVKIGRSNAANAQFRGGFDGNGVTIIIDMNASNTNYVGLFGFVGVGAEIKNLTVKGNVVGLDRVGGVIGEATGATITNVSNHANITARQYAGGIAGVITDSTLDLVYNMGNINSTNRDIGGITGWGQRSTITNAFNYGDITASLVVAGIIGYANNNMMIRNVYNRGNILSTVTSGDAWIGGIIGASYTNSYLYDSYSAGTIVSRRNAKIGGVVGGVSGVTHEENSYYDESIVEAVLLASGQVIPTQAIHNKLNQADVRGLSKAFLVGNNAKTNTNLSDETWEFISNDGAIAYYPQLKVFSNHLNDHVKEDSLESVSSYVFVGDGSKDNPYIIVTREDMMTLSNLVNDGLSFTNTYFKVKDDITEIDLTYGINYQPIGNDTTNFEGIFDGTGTNFILNLNQNKDNLGLFGVLSQFGEVRNLSVSGNIKGLNNLGSIVGKNMGLVEHVYSDAKINGHDNLGIIVGYNNGVINYVYSVGEVIGNNNIGGLVGFNDTSGITEEGYASSIIYGNLNLGGVIGYSSGYQNELYYNKSVVEVNEPNDSNLNKPFIPISNLSSSDNLLGITTNDLYGGYTNLSETHFFFEKSTGFYAYYPQLKVFSSSKYKNISNHSRDSVTVNKFNEGNGTKDDPYIIRNEFDMEAVSEMTQARYTLANTYFEVASDVNYIDLTNLRTPYQPIGNNSYHFQGSFNGNGVVFNIDIERLSTSYQGLFGVLGVNGFVTDVGVMGSIKGYDFTGGLVGRNYGIITNSYNIADIYSNRYYAGGIAGWNDGIIDTVFNSGNITANDRYAGGLVGGVAKNKELRNGYNTGNILTLGAINNTWTEAGGIAGYLAGTIENVYSTGEVSAKNSYYGGIIGRIEGQVVIDNAYYVIENNLLSNSTYKIATNPLGNGSNQNAKAIYKNQITGDHIFGVDLDTENFVLKQSNNLEAYYPQLAHFEKSTNPLIKEHSLTSVTNDLFYGLGEEENPYLIFSSFDLRALGVVVKQGLNTLDINFLVHEKANIDFTLIENNYVEIGDLDNSFKGSFDGNNILMNVLINNPIKDYQGIFGVTSNDALIKNVKAKGSIKGNNYVGLLVGFNEASLSNIVLYEIDVTGNNYVGGLTGYTNNNLTEISVKGSVSGKSNVGGLIGESNDLDLSLSYFIGKIYGNDNNVGGLIGISKGDNTLDKVFASGSINALSSSYVGGITSEFRGIITNSYVTMDITGHSYVSGIAANNYGFINEVYYSGEIKAKDKVAGLIVNNPGTLEYGYYNETELNNMRNLGDFLIPTSAIYELPNTEFYGSRKLEDMTVYYALGSDETQMNLNPELYYLREGFDFTLYFPELVSFIDYDGINKDIFKADSLKSVTYKKIDGAGTKNDPFIIYDGYDMMTVYNYVKDGIIFTNKYFKVDNSVTEIDLTGDELGYIPIGTNEYNFNGYFDGSNKVFLLDFDEDDPYIGIFHTIGNNASISNIVINGNVKGSGYIGALAGVNLGKVENITNWASVTGFSLGDGGNDVGGIIGTNKGIINNVTNNGVILSESSYVGGITGQNTGTITNAYNRAPVNGFGNVGGITGLNYGSISYSYNISNITASGDISGGITGTSNGNILESFNSGNISSGKNVSGGITGLLNGATINNVYNSGTVRVGSIHAGGIIGYLTSGTLTNAYHFGSVYGEDEIGIIIGHYESGSISRTFYDKDLLELDVPPSRLIKPTNPIGNDTLSSIKGLYHGQMLGNTAISTNNINLSNKNLYKLTGANYDLSYYPQLNVFAGSSNNTVKNDSLDSVTTFTFIVGEGTLENPYLIRNESDWIALADSTSSGNNFTNIYFIVSNEIDELNFVDSEDNYKLIPVGTNGLPFNGYLDGQGINIRVNLSSNNNYQALFGHIGPNAEVRNLSISGLIKGAAYTAGIASINEGLIESVYNTATITGTNNTGGITGLNSGTILNVYNRGKVTGTISVGGISGVLNGNIINTYNTGVVYGRENVGAIVGFYELGIFKNSYYDETILSSYRDVGSNKKPEGAVGSTFNGDNVNGLDKRFMIGGSAIGTGQMDMNFSDYIGIWTTSLNITNNNHYPQLVKFAGDYRESIKGLSNESTLTNLYKVTFDENNETESNSFIKEVSPNEHFLLYIPKYYGYNFTGWYYLNDSNNEVQLTNNKGESLNIYTLEDDLLVYAKWEEAYHLVEFLDGNNRVVYQTEVRHGEKLAIPSGIIPNKNSDSKYVYEFIDWNFNFDSIIESPLKIRANYESIDRYFNVTFLDGNDEEFLVVKAEYLKYLKEPNEIPTKQYHDDIAYKFTGWEFNFNQVIDGPVIITSNFVEVDRYYTVKFFNGDILLKTIYDAEYLFGVEAPHQMPTKDETISHTYTFNGWDKDFTKITGNLDIYALYKENLRKYNVTFVDGNNKVFESQLVDYGTSAATPALTPTKQFVDNDAFKFIRWITDYSNITGDLLVLPEFERVDRYYTVVFYDAYGDELLRHEKVEYLSEAIPPSETPTKLETVSHTYTFNNWDKDFSVVLGELHIYPVFKETLRSYNVYYYFDDLEDNQVIYDIHSVLYGLDASLPSGVPFKEGTDDVGYKFVNWDSNYKNITGDTYVKANFTEVPGMYTVTFMDGSNILGTSRVRYGYPAKAPLVDYSHPTEGYEYYFISWSRDFSFVKEDMTVNLSKGQRLMTFEVTIINGDETTTEIVEWNKNVSLPAGFKSSTEQVRYIFVGWDDDGKNIKENRTITAIFDTDYSYYEVRFYDGNDNLIKLEIVLPGNDATAPLFVTKEKLENKVFVHIGWYQDFTEVESDLSVYPIFEEKDRYYTVIFYNHLGGYIEEHTVEYGNTIEVMPPAPIKELEGKFKYDFIGWAKTDDLDNHLVDLSVIVSNLSLKPVYEESVKTFVVLFIDGNGKVIKDELVEYGLNAIAPSNPTKLPTENDYFLFREWDKSFINVTKDLEVNALFTRVDRYYTVTFVDNENNILNEQIIEYGDDAIDPIPIIDYKDIYDDNYLYVITGWEDDFTNVTKNLTVKAIFGIVDRYYDVRFNNYDGSLIVLHEKVEYGTNITPPEDPEKEGNNDYFYVFNSWDKDSSYVTSNLIITALFDEFKTRYTVTFNLDDGSLFTSLIIDYGYKAYSPGQPYKESTDEVSFIFSGWYLDDLLFDFNTPITSDLVLEAKYSVSARTYLVIFKDEQGNVIDEQLVRKGESAVEPNNIPEIPPTDYIVYVHKWDRPLSNITEDTIINLYYEEVARVYYATFYDDGGKKLGEISGTYGQYITPWASPEKEMTSKHYYEFSGWYPLFNEYITEDVTYTATYDEILRVFSVLFKDGNGDIFEEQFIAYGQTPNKPLGTPIKDKTDQYEFVFRMWETTTIKVYQDLVINALFYSNLREYQVTFIDEEGNLLSRQMVLYGTGALEPDFIPSKPNTNTHEYAFAGWDKSFSYITEDLIVQTLYVGAPRKYVYEFYLDDHMTLIKRVVGYYGDTIIEPTRKDIEKLKVGTDHSYFVFDGWENGPVSNTLTQNERYYAIFKEELNEYRVIFIDGNDNLFDEQLVKHGASAIDPVGIKGNPIKDPNEKYEFIFTGWDVSFDEITNTLTVRALFNQELRQFKVTFYVNNKVYDIIYVEYGENAYNLVGTPVVVGYSFNDWDKLLTKIVNDTETHAILRANNITIDFEDGYLDGELIPVEGDNMKRIVNKFGEEVTLPKNTYTRKGYVFAGWINHDDDTYIYLDEATFKITEVNYLLKAYWVPEDLFISYELDGGKQVGINPYRFTVLDEIVLNPAQKDDHKFLGWLLTDCEEEFISDFISEIEPGTIFANITLTAIYEYDGYIQLKDEEDRERKQLGMFYADIENSMIPVIERDPDFGDLPVYLLGVFLGQTVEQLRNDFINDDLIFLDKNGNPLLETDVVRTGMVIAILDNDDPDSFKDSIEVVLKGDIDGDGRVDIFDLNSITNHIAKLIEIESSSLLAAMIDDDSYVDVFDLNALTNHLAGLQMIDYDNFGGF